MSSTLKWQHSTSKKNALVLAALLGDPQPEAYTSIILTAGSNTVHVSLNSINIQTNTSSTRSFQEVCDTISVVAQCCLTCVRMGSGVANMAQLLAYFDLVYFVAGSIEKK